MKRSLVIGKFMPIHNGHIALINFAASQCDELEMFNLFKSELESVELIISLSVAIIESGKKRLKRL